jgi:two-component system chemotaxis response regulator CheB
MPGRDIVVIGGSAGGINALLDLLQPLPLGLPAALFVVVHTSPEGGGLLGTVLGRAAGWHADMARDGEPIRHGRIYLAPPDHHLLVKRKRVRVTRGPRENRFRPAVDPLFRTAALAYGPQVIGIVLSGGLDDGSHGLDLIKRHGGLAIAQDPEEAIAPDMPLNAIQNVEVDYILKAAAIAHRLPRLVTEQVGNVPWDDNGHGEGRPDVAEGTAANIDKVTGPPSEFTCPECGGTLWELEGGRLLRYRCHLGHGYTANSLVADQSDSLDNALWTALRALEEHSMLRRRMAEHARDKGLKVPARHLEHEAKQAELRASTIRQLLHAERVANLESQHVDSRRAVAADRSPSRGPGRLTPGVRTRKANR